LPEAFLRYLAKNKVSQL